VLEEQENLPLHHELWMCICGFLNFNTMFFGKRERKGRNGKKRWFFGDKIEDEGFKACGLGG
jgi:hypothetical protein